VTISTIAETYTGNIGFHSSVDRSSIGCSGESYQEEEAYRDTPTWYPRTRPCAVPSFVSSLAMGRSLDTWLILTSCRISTSQRPVTRTSSTTATPAKRNRQRSSPIAPPHPGTHPAYNPFSVISYLSRLRTFSLTTFPTKPPALSPQACAQAGWIHEGGKDRLFCRVCQNAWRVEVPGDVVGGIRLSDQMSELCFHGFRSALKDGLFQSKSIFGCWLNSL
jgi:hypothetical protein